MQHGGGFFGDIGHGIEDVGRGLLHGAEDIGHGIEDAGKGLLHGAESIGGSMLHGAEDVLGGAIKMILCDPNVRPKYPHGPDGCGKHESPKPTLKQLYQGYVSDDQVYQLGDF